jgi:PAS domain S-box-containing protein
MPDINPEIYSQIFLHAPIGIAVSDESGAVVTANETLLKIGGYRREDLSGKAAVDFYYDGAVDRERVLKLAQANRGILDRCELRFKRKDGSFFWALMSLRPTAIGDKRYMIAMIEDVDDAKRAKEESERSNEELARMAQMLVGRETRMVELKKRVATLEDDIKTLKSRPVRKKAA